MLFIDTRDFFPACDLRCITGIALALQYDIKYNIHIEYLQSRISDDFIVFIQKDGLWGQYEN